MRDGVAETLLWRLTLRAGMLRSRDAIAIARRCVRLGFVCTGDPLPLMVPKDKVLKHVSGSWQRRISYKIRKDDDLDPCRRTAVESARHRR